MPFINSRSLLTAAVAVALPALCALAADPGRLTVRVDRPGVTISPMLYGLMTEEINHSYDGGLYAELIRNRTFKEDAQQPAHWSVVKSEDSDGQIALDTDEPVNTTALTTSLRLEIAKADKGQRCGIANDGYWGIPVRPNTQYRAAFYAKAGGGFSGPLTVNIESNDSATVHASAILPAVGSEWKRYTVTLATGQAAPSVANRFVISAVHPGKVWFSLVSLFPPTYNDRPNGNRIDMMQKLADMHPAFLRLPGGNYLEGDTIAERFDWKKTLGDISLRPGHRCCWNYPSSDGMGLLEYLEWCEDLHVEPVLAVYAGYSLRGEHVGPGTALEPFVAEALDEIEYVTGDQSTAWGKRRAQDGHPEPFKLQYVEIGNEDEFDRSRSYDGRFAQFYDAIKAKYPALQLIATTPVKTRRPDVIDDHYYRSAHDMAGDARHYDKYDRSGPKIFVGEWASTEGSPTPTLQAALGDAAWLTGLERNSDLVLLSCYAPLLVNVNPGAHQWATNLIGYDAVSSFGSPSYYVQKMFAENRGDTVLPVEVVAQKAALAEMPAPTAASASAPGSPPRSIKTSRSRGEPRCFFRATSPTASAVGGSMAAPGRCARMRSANPAATPIAGPPPATRTGPITPTASRPAKLAARRASSSSFMRLTATTSSGGTSVVGATVAPRWRRAAAVRARNSGSPPRSRSKRIAGTTSASN